VKYIELFAGCGGLSLGLESAGFENIFINELSPMAAETFSFNLLDEDLDQLAKDQLANDDVSPTRTLWINSRFDANNLAARLKENPQNLPKADRGYSDLEANLAALKGKLLVGSIIDLNKYLVKNPKLAKEIARLDIDLVSGGPPCQSFSLAGMRQHDNKRNTLPKDFAEFVSHTKPKIALLENVSGILRAFKLADGSKHFAWFEVARAFAHKGYIPVCLHVNAKNAGAAQNRPRFILLAFREDVYKDIAASKIEEPIKGIFEQSLTFFKQENRDRKNRHRTTRPGKDLDYYDIDKDKSVFDDPIFASLNQYKDKTMWHSARYAIDDLKIRKNYSQGDYSKFLDRELTRLTHKQSPKGVPENHKKRINNNRVRRRFRVYQVISKAPNGITKDVIAFLTNPKKYELSKETVKYMRGKKFLTRSNNLDSKDSYEEFKSKKGLSRYLEQLATKKQTQKALLANKPAPATLSIPDDACHYDQKEIRTLTVREMARFQSFPDWF